MASTGEEEEEEGVECGQVVEIRRQMPRGEDQSILVSSLSIVVTIVLSCNEKVHVTVVGCRGWTKHWGQSVRSSIEGF